MSEQKYKKLEELYRDLRLAYSVLSDKDDKDHRYSLCRTAGISLYGPTPLLPVTFAEVQEIAKWKIEALEQELKALQGEKP